MQAIFVLIGFLVLTVGIDVLALHYGLQQTWLEAGLQSIILNNISLIILPILAIPFAHFARSSWVIDMLFFSPPAWMLQSIVIEALFLYLMWNITFKKSYQAVFAGNIAAFAIAFGAYPVTAALIG